MLKTVQCASLDHSPVVISTHTRFSEKVSIAECKLVLLVVWKDVVLVSVKELGEVKLCPPPQAQHMSEAVKSSSSK
jgi:hypothetical protein